MLVKGTVKETWKGAETWESQELIKTYKSSILYGPVSGNRYKTVSKLYQSIKDLE